MRWRKGQKGGKKEGRRSVGGGQGGVQGGGEREEPGAAEKGRGESWGVGRREEGSRNLGGQEQRRSGRGGCSPAARPSPPGHGAPGSAAAEFLPPSLGAGAGGRALARAGRD